MEIKNYIDLLPTANRNSPKFLKMIEVNVSVFVHFQKVCDQLIALMDIDSADGVWLDVIGCKVGADRKIKIPISDAYFEWDSESPYNGWEYGIWDDDVNSTSITALPDDVYRQFLKAKIAANHWDGTIEGAYKVWGKMFDKVKILIDDHQNMTYDLLFAGEIIDSLTVALVLQGYLPLKPEGVRVENYAFSVDDDPIFAWDMDTDLMKGWDEGSWVREE